jgi:hypothetical protein
MVPAIGVMIAAYIITRMIEIMGRQDRGFGLKFISGLTILVVLICLIDILNAGLRSGSMPRF